MLIIIQFGLLKGHSCKAVASQSCLQCWASWSIYQTFYKAWLRLRHSCPRHRLQHDLEDIDHLHWTFFLYFVQSNKTDLSVCKVKFLRNTRETGLFKNLLFSCASNCYERNVCDSTVLSFISQTHLSNSCPLVTALESTVFWWLHRSSSWLMHARSFTWNSSRHSIRPWLWAQTRAHSGYERTKGGGGRGWIYLKIIWDKMEGSYPRSEKQNRLSLSSSVSSQRSDTTTFHHLTHFYVYDKSF